MHLHSVDFVAWPRATHSTDARVKEGEEARLCFTMPLRDGAEIASRCISTKPLMPLSQPDANGAFSDFS